MWNLLCFKIFISSLVANFGQLENKWEAEKSDVKSLLQIAIGPLYRFQWASRLLLILDKFFLICGSLKNLFCFRFFSDNMAGYALKRLMAEYKRWWMRHFYKFLKEMRSILFDICSFLFLTAFFGFHWCFLHSSFAADVVHWMTVCGHRSW